ncbi:hypothetical protein [Fluviispira vulneris]|uniref:hypothetical protein n=1 Tax=Fluviispira vulneris TaxID=2763012 RepID=UPI001647DAC5|nr:hypothetical protein [Fluviispira vulneris]
MTIAFNNVFKLFLLFPFILFANAYSSEKAYVYCYSPLDDRWEWLTDSNSNYVTADGEWKTKQIGTYLLKFFQITSQNSDEIESFRNQCITKYGKSYKFVQPTTDSSFDFHWKPFALSDQQIVNGRIEVRVFRFLGGRAFNHFCKITLPYSPDQRRYLSIPKINQLIGNRSCS